MKPTEVLFVCVHNAGRSQMAAALLAHYAPEDVVVRSAGSMPAETMNPVAKTALEELGVAILDGIPKKLEDAMVQASDFVITMGCGDACAIYPGKNYLDWKLEDPAGQGIESVRAIRNDIDLRVRLLLKELFPEKDFSESVIN